MGVTDNSSSPEQVNWTVDGLAMAGLAWGPRDGLPVLALHGWLDNAASFEVLAPLLGDFRIVAPDLTGHGLSDHRSDDATYLIWDDVPQLLKLMDQLGWRDCVFLGHSRGAMISTLLSGTMPERVRGLITLDGPMPQPQTDAQFAVQLRDSFRYTARLATRGQRRFETIDEFLERRERYGVTRDIATRLAARTLEPRDGGYLLRGDQRLYSPSAVKLNRGQIESILRALSMPVLQVWASDGLAKREWAAEALAIAKACIGDLTTVTVEGHHHFHMEQGAAAEIAGLVRDFVARL